MLTNKDKQYLIEGVLENLEESSNFKKMDDEKLILQSPCCRLSGFGKFRFQRNGLIGVGNLYITTKRLIFVPRTRGTMNDAGGMMMGGGGIEIDIKDIRNVDKGKVSIPGHIFTLGLATPIMKLFGTWYVEIEHGSGDDFGNALTSFSIMKPDTIISVINNLISKNKNLIKKF